MLSSEQSKIELNLQILKAFKLNRDTSSRPLALPSLSLAWFAWHYSS